MATCDLNPISLTKGSTIWTMAVQRRIAITSYLDMVPFLYGIKNAPECRAELLLSSPARCAELIAEGAVDIALVPTATADRLRGVRILSEYCLSSTERLATARMECDVPLQQIEQIVYDAEWFITPEILGRLCTHLWRIAPKLIDRRELPAEWQPAPTDAEIICGTEAFTSARHRRYEFDLGEEWRRSTRSPLVLGVWVVRADVTPDESDNFERTLTFGIEHTWEALTESELASPESYIQLTERIDYLYDQEKDKALRKLWREGVKVAPRANPG